MLIGRSRGACAALSSCSSIRTAHQPPLIGHESVKLRTYQVFNIMGRYPPSRLLDDLVRPRHIVAISSGGSCCGGRRHPSPEPISNQINQQAWDASLASPRSSICALRCLGLNLIPELLRDDWPRSAGTAAYPHSSLGSCRFGLSRLQPPQRSSSNVSFQVIGGRSAMPDIGAHSRSAGYGVCPPRARGPGCEQQSQIFLGSFNA